jgi:GMP synthase (glutamine-hydrolysing)
MSRRKSALVLTHADFEGPARIADLVARAGYAIEVRSLHRGGAVPSRMDPASLLVVMGGSMGVGDVGRAEFPFLHDEVRLLRQRIEEDAPVLGVCLGAQLLAHAAGARVYPMAERGGTVALEVGWGTVRFHHESGDETLAGLGPEGPVLHWHGDMFDVPPRREAPRVERDLPFPGLPPGAAPLRTAVSLRGRRQQRGGFSA